MADSPSCPHCGEEISPKQMKTLTKLSNAQGTAAEIARMKAGGQSLLKSWSGKSGNSLRVRAGKALAQ